MDSHRFCRPIEGTFSMPEMIEWVENKELRVALWTEALDVVQSLYVNFLNTNANEFDLIPIEAHTNILRPASYTSSSHTSESRDWMIRLRKCSRLRSIDGVTYCRDSGTDPAAPDADSDRSTSTFED